MKARITHVALLALAGVLLSGICASQMVIKRVLFRVDAPFAFMAGGSHLPAGEYIVAHLDPNLIEIMKQDGSARALAHVAIEDLDRSAITKLVFNKYEGEQYFLASVWTEQDSQVHHCTKGVASDCSGWEVSAGDHPGEALNESHWHSVRNEIVFERDKGATELQVVAPNYDVSAIAVEPHYKRVPL